MTQICRVESSFGSCNPSLQNISFPGQDSSISIISQSPPQTSISPRQTPQIAQFFRRDKAFAFQGEATHLEGQVAHESISMCFYIIITYSCRHTSRPIWNPSPSSPPSLPSPPPPIYRPSAPSQGQLHDQDPDRKQEQARPCTGNIYNCPDIQRPALLRSPDRCADCRNVYKMRTRVACLQAGLWLGYLVWSVLQQEGWAVRKGG